MNALRLAFGFLTSLPVGATAAMSSGDLARAATWFPLVGLGIGAGLWGFERLIGSGLPSLATAALLVALWVAATGALHLDGLADCCDGLLASATADRKLEIMRDSRAGSFAIAGVSLLLVMKVAAVSGLAQPHALLLAPVLGRFWMLPLALMPPARDHGLGARLHSELGPMRTFLVGLVVVAAIAAAGARAWAALAATGAVTAGVALFARAQIGGHTGDVLGANCEFAELIALLTFLWR